MFQADESPNIARPTGIFATMPDELTIDEFLARPPGVPLIDVRTPDEFNAGHIPGAINVPLFSNAERVEIGTAYKQEGRKRAVSIGLRCVGPRLENLADTLLNLADPDKPRLHLHCWRGGMRSGSVAWLMETMLACQVATLKGGYKTFRHWVLNSFSIPREVRIVSGLTGSGKTEILKQLAELGENTVDLEGLANHKGSAFGQLGEAPQPTQVQFENALAMAWRATDPERPVWLEDESRMVGKRVLPEALWKQKRNARFHVIELPDDERIAHLCKIYADFAPVELEASVGAIRSRLGGDRTNATIKALHCGNFTEACRMILSYYDRTYQKCLILHPPENITRHPFLKLDPLTIASTLVESTHPSP
jgi:tRNA 2-selenouridine synthase